MPSQPPAHRAPSRRYRLLIASLAACLVAAGCGTSKNVQVYAQEKFEHASSHSRSFGVSAAHSCEAARRALLSHGYRVQRSSAELVDGRKSFQPSADSHVEIEFHVVCAQEGQEQSTVFVNALQDLYALKKTSNSASLGVGPVGSVSLPFGSSTDSLVKISSETIPSRDFYDRFFALVEHHLALVDPDEPEQPSRQSAAPPSAIPSPVLR